jgi:carbonic anhydrase/acetyltransferase-like protein (isoleucine patch superfamily)
MSESAGMLIALGDARPRVAAGAFVAPTAVLIGDVVVEEEASVWFGAVLRGDYNRIVVGRGSCIQDGAVIHTAGHTVTSIGASVTVGHLAMLEGCTVADDALIGTGSIVLQRASIGRKALVAAGSVVKEGQAIPDCVLAAGVPATVRKELSGSALEWAETAAADYRDLRLRYLNEAHQLD